MGDLTTFPNAAIVSGGTRGIGSGIAESLAAAGTHLLLTYNTDRTAAEAFATQLRSTHPALQVVLVGGDISLPSTRDSIFELYDLKFSKSHRLTVVVHNAGQYLGVTSSNSEGLSGPVTPMGFGDGTLLTDTAGPDLSAMHYYQRMYGDAYIDLCERGLARMTAGGSLIGISAPGCNALQRPTLGYDLPGAGKCVMEYSMRLFAVRCAHRGINCNLVIPGITVTDAWERLASKHGLEKEAMLDSVLHSVPMRRAIHVNTIGDVVAFLCSVAGSNITGVSLPVDGGLHLSRL